MRTSMKGAAVLAAVVLLGAGHRPAAGQSLTPAERRFVNLSTLITMMEARLGQLALERDASPAVKKLARRLAEDCSKREKLVRAWAEKNEIDLPTTLGDRQQRAVQRLNALNGAAFDRAYVEQVLEDQRLLLELFEEATKTGQNRAVKEFVAKTLPAVREHLKLAEEVAKGLGVRP
jgi:putative membrane protein